MKRLPPYSVLLALVATALIAPTPGVRAWSPETQVAIAREASRLAPPDLRRQIDKDPDRLQEGVLAPFREGDREAHFWHSDGAGDLDHTAFRETRDAIDAIRSHRPFSEILWHLGRISHWIADANNPLNAMSDDPREGRYHRDFLRYVQSAQGRFSRVFYAAEPEVTTDRELRLLVYRALHRGRELYPFVGAEYRRIGFASGVSRFDDRSTAFGVAAVSFNRAVSDVARVFRYVWVTAGGAPGPSPVWEADGDLVLLMPGGEKAR